MRTHIVQQFRHDIAGFVAAIVNAASKNRTFTNLNAITICHDEYQGGICANECATLAENLAQQTSETRLLSFGHLVLKQFLQTCAYFQSSSPLTPTRRAISIFVPHLTPKVADMVQQLCVQGEEMVAKLENYCMRQNYSHDACEYTDTCLQIVQALLKDIGELLKD